MTEEKAVVFQSTRCGNEGVVGHLILNRADRANAFGADTMDALSETLDEISQMKNLRALVISGAGKHFSAGADLNWMKNSSQLSYDENIADSGRLTAMFEKLYNLPVVTIALVKGAAYGGAVGLIACCDITLCHEDAKICLSEVKLGLLPAVIFPYLGRRMHPGALRRASLTGRLITANEASHIGLCDVVFSDSDAEEKLREELNLVLSGGPQAQASIKKLNKILSDDDFKQNPVTQEYIARARTGVEGQAGLSAFFAKSAPYWKASTCDNLIDSLINPKP